MIAALTFNDILEKQDSGFFPRWSIDHIPLWLLLVCATLVGLTVWYDIAESMREKKTGQPKDKEMLAMGHLLTLCVVAITGVSGINYDFDAAFEDVATQQLQDKYDIIFVEFEYDPLILPTNGDEYWQHALGQKVEPAEVTVLTEPNQRHQYELFLDPEANESHLVEMQKSNTNAPKPEQLLR